MTDVAVIDYGVGNLLSVSRALAHCGANVSVTDDPVRIRAASDPAALGPQDLVIVATKNSQLADIAKQLPPLCGPDTPVIFPATLRAGDAASIISASRPGFTFGASPCSAKTVTFRRDTSEMVTMG